MKVKITYAELDREATERRTQELLDVVRTALIRHTGVTKCRKFEVSLVAKGDQLCDIQSNFRKK